MVTQTIYTGATPGPYEREVSQQIVDQVIRPTGLLDPVVEIRPVKGQVLELRGDPADPVCGRILASERVYVVPRRDGRLIIGATSEEMGFDTTVTAGGVHELLREAYRLLPDIAELEFIEATAGLRPATPDNIPVVGATGVEGLLMATGHYRNGILLAPLTARTIADLSEGATVTGPMTGADPSRFKDRDLAVTG